MKLALIEWEDSFGAGASWSPIPDEAPVPLICVSIGWIAQETDRLVVVVPHFHVGRDDIGLETSGCGDMAIPRSAIISIKQLGAYDAGTAD